MAVSRLLVTFLLLSKRSFASPFDTTSPVERPNLSTRQVVPDATPITSAPGFLSSDTTNHTITEAERLLARVIAKQSAYNKYRVANPRRNIYARAPSTSKVRRGDPEGAPLPPVLNATILAAAALIAERDAAQQLANGTLHLHSKRSVSQNDGNLVGRSSSYWLPQMSGNGLAPMNSNPNYQVYRDVTRFGATGNGVTDDTDAINSAIAAGNNCGSGCLSSSIKGTLIYFPPGTYLISSPINAYYYSQLVGDAINPPTIKTSAQFVGLGAIQTDVYVPGANSAEWYIDQSNFYRQVRNFIVDISGTTTASVAGFHWQVAQATSLTNVQIIATTQGGQDNTQLGMFSENGSGGFMSDVTITGGAYGLYAGNQQYTVRNVKITGQAMACIAFLWDWGWTWSNLYLANAPIGISLINPQGEFNQTVPGSTYVMDSTFSNLQTGIYAHFNSSHTNSSIITLDNLAVSNVANMLQFSGGGSVDIPAGNIDFVVTGDVVDQGFVDGSYTYSAPVRPQGLVSSSTIVQPEYFVRSRPQYESIATSSIISVKANGAFGDGVHDDTAAIQKTLQKATTGNLIYFPAGSYLISSTILIQAGTRITGEVWSQLVATGSHFTNMNSPQPMVRVGNPGDSGVVEISDMLFTSIGSLPGLILMEWNIKASSQGSAGMWDSHFRLGGAYGTQLQVAQCPYNQAPASGCTAASMMLHMTSNSNGYLENVWAWVADHDIDDADNKMVSIAAARGILIESSGPTWMYGTSSEHSLLYQYNFANSTDTLAGMIQTESPYFQGVSGSGQSPGPFASSIGVFSSDPPFPDSTCSGSSLQCNFAWAVLMQSTTNLTIPGAGLYSWFSNYGQSCVDAQNCQQRLVYDDGNNNQLQLWNLITIGAVEMVSAPQANFEVPAQQFTESTGHPYWSAIAGYLNSAQPIVLSCSPNDTRPYCQDQSLCDFTPTYSSFAALNSAIGSVPNECVDNLAMNTLYNVLNGSVANYTNVNKGYDSAFKYYVQYMHDLLPGAVSSFMAQATPNAPGGGPGNPFFSCTLQGRDRLGKTVTASQQCPFTYKQLELASYTITYTLTNATGFNATLSSHGIDPSWVTFGNSHISQTLGCLPRADYCITIDEHFNNIPQAVKNAVIPNPKTFITKSFGNVTTIQDNILAAQMSLNLGGWNGSSDDMVQSFSIPVFLFQQSVDSMAHAKAIGQKQAKEDKIKLIVEILTGIFAVLPFTVEFLPELQALRFIVQYVTLAANTALSIQGAVADPAEAPFAILGLLLGGIGHTEDGVAEAAAARRAMTEADISSFGDDFDAANSEFQSIVRQRCDI